jgi:hydrogenase expression/formation protein HypE
MKQDMQAGRIRRRSGRLRDPRITLSHGGGGKAMRDLIDDAFVDVFANDVLAALEDQARIALADLAAAGDRLAFTTDSYVVDPRFLPGANVGRRAVKGTVLLDTMFGGARIVDMLVGEQLRRIC